jgi:hypothetical protein
MRSERYFRPNSAGWLPFRPLQTICLLTVLSHHSQEALDGIGEKRIPLFAT